MYGAYRMALIEFSGKELYAGSEKICYELKPGYVLLNGDIKDLRSEQWMLGRLRNLGLPVLEVHLMQFYHVEIGRKEWGLVAPRYDFHFFPCDTERKNSIILDGTYITQMNRRHHRHLVEKILPGHIESLRRIMQVFKNKKVNVQDLQFLCRGESDVVICDPYLIRVNKGYNYSWRDVKRTIEFLGEICGTSLEF